MMYGDIACCDMRYIYAAGPEAPVEAPTRILTFDDGVSGFTESPEEEGGDVCATQFIHCFSMDLMLM